MFSMQIHKWIWTLALLLLSSNSYAEVNHESLNYRVSRNDYYFSTIFDMSTDKQSMGSVLKSVFHLTTHYDAYDCFGLYEGQGICRFFCLGLFYTWGTEIDVYDADGNRIGLIDGQVMTAEPAKFSFYADGNCAAIGYLDQNCMGFSLVDPKNPTFVLAQLKRNFILDTVDNWDVMIYHPELLPPRLVKIFAAFVCDTQHKFKPDL